MESWVFFHLVVSLEDCRDCYKYQQSCDTPMTEQLQEQVLLLGAAVKAEDLVLGPGWNRWWSIQKLISVGDKRLDSATPWKQAVIGLLYFHLADHVLNWWCVSYAVQAQGLQYHNVSNLLYVLSMAEQKCSSFWQNSPSLPC